MPPKQTKEERERLKREEAERKAREEEEQHQREEEERLKQEEQDRQEREERARLKTIEEARFVEERGRLGYLVDELREAQEQWKREQLEKKQWDRYLTCSDLPDPSDEKALNMYLSLHEEDNSDATIDYTMVGITNCLMLTWEMKHLLVGEGLPSPTEKEAERYRQTISRVHSTLQRKLDRSTLHYMGEAEKYVDSETYNLRVEAQTPDITFCLWGNVVKNPRLKNFTFHKHHFVLDLPKPLLLADIAVRLLLLPSDTLSPHSRSFHCKTQPLDDNSTASVETRSTVSGEAPGDQGADEGGEEASGSGSTREGSTVSKQEENDQPVSDQQQEAEDAQEPDRAGEKEEGEEGKEEEQLNQNGDAPPPPAVEDGSEEVIEEDEIDLRAFRPARGPFLLELLELPPPAKVMNNWTIRKVVSQDLTPYPYPAEAAKPSASTVATTTSSEDQQQQAPPAVLPGSSMWPAINITMKLPEPFLFPEQPQLAQWDSGEKIWRTNRLQEVTFDLEERTVSFQTFYFSPVAVMADLYVNMPYESWSLLPMSPDVTLVTLTGGTLEISVEIKQHICSLVAPTEEPAVSHLINRPMSIRELIEALKKVGVYFFPEPDGDKYVSVTPKTASLELLVYQHMALVSRTFAFQWSKWNSKATKNKFIVKACECLKDTPMNELPWKVYAGGSRSRRLKITEDSSQFSMETLEGCEVHADLYSTLESDASPQAKERLKSTSPMHIETVQQWLTATRVLTYS